MNLACIRSLSIGEPKWLIEEKNRIPCSDLGFLGEKPMMLSWYVFVSLSERASFPNARTSLIGFRVEAIKRGIFWLGN
jgi:hypothetical protein